VAQWVTTTVVLPTDSGFMDTVFNELAAGCDVEILSRGHIATVTGLVQGNDGSWAIDVSHDVMQGKPGGNEVETIKFDPDIDRIARGGYGFNLKLIEGFV